MAWARLGREEAYGELLRRYQPTVLGLIEHMVRDHDLAEDLTQETFFKAFKRLDSQHSEHKFSAWILKIANNTAIDYFRRDELDTLPLDDGPAVTPSPRDPRTSALQLAAATDSTPLPRRQARRLGPALEQAIRGLRREYRRCLLLRYVEERSYEEIAEITGLPVGTVGTYIRRALGELEATLDPLLDSLPADPTSTPV